MSVDRDRDERGRPRNARARDALGRPLARGVPGVGSLPDDLSLGPAESLIEAQRLLDAGLAFQAHEVLEAAWKLAPPAERNLWQGLAQLAVGLTHALRGNAVGATTLLDRGAVRLGEYAPSPPHGVDASGLIAWARSSASALADGSAPSTPCLRRR